MSKRDRWLYGASRNNFLDSGCMLNKYIIYTKLPYFYVTYFYYIKNCISAFSYMLLAHLTEYGLLIILIVSFFVMQCTLKIYLP
jgi:hypothetical protein